MEGFKQGMDNHAMSRAPASRLDKTSRPIFFCLFPVDGDGSGGYGKMIACSE